MDIEKLIDRLGENTDCWTDKVHGYADLRLDAATTLSTLQAENAKLRAELEQKEKYYEQMVDALAATESADLAQMTACVYYKPGGLCRYGGDDPANVCVLGPCPHERTAEEVLADLARMTAERDAIEQDFRAFTKQWWEQDSGFPCRWCKFEKSEKCEWKSKHKGQICAGGAFEWRGQKEN